MSLWLATLQQAPPGIDWAGLIRPAFFGTPPFDMWMTTIAFPGDLIEDLVTITGEQRDADARPPDDSSATRWRYGYPCDDLLNALCDPVGDRRITGPSVIGGNLSKIGGGPASNTRPSCLPEAGECRLDLLLAVSFAGKPFVDRGQFIRCRLVGGAGEFCLDFSASSADSCCRSSGQVGTRSNTALIWSLVIMSYPILAGGPLRCPGAQTHVNDLLDRHGWAWPRLSG